MTTYYAVLIQRKKDRLKRTPVTEPLAFGRAERHDPNIDCLLRRGELTLFKSRDDAEQALRQTREIVGSPSFFDDCEFRIIECQENRNDR